MSGNPCRNDYENIRELLQGQELKDGQNLADINRQIKTLFKSLTPCTKISKGRSVDVHSSRGSGMCRSAREPSAKASLTFERNFIVSHVTNNDKKLRYLQKSRAFSSREEILISSDSNTSRDGGWKSEGSSAGITVYDSQTSRRKASSVELYPHEKVDPIKMIEIIQRELSTLLELAPSVGGIITGFCNSVLHYKECERCSDKISPSLPWILSRIQKLIKYVTTKRRKSYVWPDDYSYLRLSSHDFILKEVDEEGENKDSLSEEVSPVQDQEVLIGKLEEVDASTISDARPGVQLLLEVAPLKNKKRFFQTTANEELRGDLEAGEHFPTLQLRNHVSEPLVQVLQPRQKPRIFLRRKQEVVFLKEFSFAFRLLLSRRPQVVAVALIGCFLSRWVELQRATYASFPKEVQPLEVQSLQSRQNSRTLLLRPEELQFIDLQSLQSRKNSQRLLVKQEKAHPIEVQNPQPKKTSLTLLVKQKAVRPAKAKVNSFRLKQNAQKLLVKEKEVHIAEEIAPLPTGYLKRPHDGLTIRDLLSDAPKIILDLLEEAEQEKMHLQKMKQLEAEVRGLKDLMLEVHKNQVDLSKVFLDKGIISQQMIKLTDPNVLLEEQEAVRKAAAMDVFRRTSSIESIQVTVADLRQKCALKNKMLEVLLKGLHSRVPKECWEELIRETFDDRKPVETFDPGRVSEFIAQASLFRLYNDKESSAEMSSPQPEQLPSEEEAMARGMVGADFGKDLKFLSYFDHLMAKPRSFLDFRFPLAVMAYPASENTEVMIRNLENQISLLNMENDRLWHQVDELRDLLKASVKEMNERVGARFQSERPKPSEKLINLTIQIGDKGFRRPKEEGLVFRIDNNSHENIRDYMLKDAEMAKCPAVDSHLQEQTIEIQEQEEFGQGVSFIPSTKSNRRHSENDLNYLDDVSPTVSDINQENEKLRALLRERAVMRPVQQVLMNTPHPSTQDVIKPYLWMPQQNPFTEVSDGFQAGPSRRQDFDGLLQKPSMMELVDSRSPGMFATMANERELQTIPENDSPDSCPSVGFTKGITQAIQRLRARVRSMHKDVAVLKSKNDRIDKLLGRLMDDVVENKDSFHEFESGLKEHLG